MVGHQRTFELIPTSLVTSNGPKPPMTSKQAKKAHQLATRGPKISRAEERRRVAEELARQKKEHERERASSKAKAVREKKAIREQAERAERKRLGQPEPSRFVRASQPTISRFVKKGNNQICEMETVEEAEHSDLSTVCDGEYSSNPEHPAKKVKTGGGLDDGYGESPSFSQPELEQVDSSEPSESKEVHRLVPDNSPSNIKADSTNTPPRVVGSAKGIGTSDSYLISHPAPASQLVETLPARNARNGFHWDSLENVHDMVATQLRSEVAATMAEVVSAQSPLNPVGTTMSCPSLLSRISSPTSSLNWPHPKSASIACLPVSGPDCPHTIEETAQKKRPALRNLSANMPPPPTRPKRATSTTPSPPKPRAIPPKSLQIISRSTLLPSATQVFLEDHLDDFFPSPSQEIRELLEDLDDLPSNTQIARELSLEPDVSTNRAWKGTPFDDIICTQDFILSSQDILEITTPCRPGPKLKRSAELSTPAPKPATRQLKQRLFVEKEEDLLHAAIWESKGFAAKQEQRNFEREVSGRVEEVKTAAPGSAEEGRAKEAAGRSTRVLQRTVSGVTDYGEEELHDCEEELLAL